VNGSSRTIIVLVARSSGAVRVLNLGGKHGGHDDLLVTQDDLLYHMNY